MHPRGAAAAEIGFERRGQRGARGERGKRRRGEARGLAKALGLVEGERARPDPGEPWPVRRRPDSIFMQTGQPRGRQASAGQLRPAGCPLPRKLRPRIPAPRSPRRSRPATARRAGRSRGWGEASMSAPPASGARPRPGARRASPEKARDWAFRRPHRPARRGLKRAAWMDHRLDNASLSSALPLRHSLGEVEQSFNQMVDLYV